MYLDTVGEITATRQLRLLNADGSQEEILILIGKPQPSSDSIGFYCPFQITGVGTEKIKYAKGVDSVQALQSVMLLIGLDLEFLNETMGKRLRWDGDGEGGLGFPVVQI
jgi:hypothetical protein